MKNHLLDYKLSVEVKFIVEDDELIAKGATKITRLSDNKTIYQTFEDDNRVFMLDNSLKMIEIIGDILRQTREVHF